MPLFSLSFAMMFSIFIDTLIDAVIADIDSPMIFHYYYAYYATLLLRLLIVYAMPLRFMLQPLRYLPCLPLLFAIDTLPCHYAARY